METQTVLKRAAEKCGLTRSRYNERRIPTSIEDVVVLPFFGDHRSSFIMSSLLLRRAKEEMKSSKYFVLASWPGHEGLYPYVDEYWQMEDESALDVLRNGCSGFFNDSQVSSLMTRTLNQFFYDVMSWRDFLEFYDNGITRGFFDRFKHIKLTLPSVPSSASLGVETSRGLAHKERKIFIYPSKYAYSWKFASSHRISVDRNFWIDMLGACIDARFCPVVCSDVFSHDLSADSPDGCFHFKNMDALRMLSLMRLSGCVVDVFNGISRLSIAARAPFVCFDERSRFNGQKEYEINDICSRGIQREYIFGFATILESKDSWRSNVFDHLVLKMNKIYDSMDRDSWPSPAEINEIVPYEAVRKTKSKRLGARFVKVERI